jgi:phosphoglucosamine mutase
MLETDIALAQPENIGRAKRIDDALGRYEEYAKTTFPAGLRLDGLKVVIDCANGAAYKAAPEVLWELGAEVIPVGVNPNGKNINQRCGSTYTQTAAEAVVAHGAHVGISLDGDADRVMILDETGCVADGDQIMALLAGRWADEGRLQGGTLVATVMSNLGLERFMTGRGLRLERTSVGDRYVVEAMRRGGFNLGGEQSGHIVMTDYATTGDGLIAGLQFLAEMARSGKAASELVQQFETVPQMLKNVRYTPGLEPLKTAAVQAVIAAKEAVINGKGRILIRKSGTEPLIRVMAECEDEAMLREVVDEIVGAVLAAV